MKTKKRNLKIVKKQMIHPNLRKHVKHQNFHMRKNKHQGRKKNQQQEKSVHKRKINVTPQKDSKKPNKENSPGPKKQSGSKLPGLKTVEKQNASARRSLEDKLHRQISKVREPKNERVRTENNKPPSNPDRSRSPSRDRRPDREDRG